MKKYLHILLIVVYFSSFALAQNGFYKSIDVWGYANGITDLLVDNDTIVIYGTAGIDSLSGGGQFFMKIDTFGNIINSKLFLNDSLKLLSTDKGNLIKTHDGGYAICGTTWDSIYKHEIYLLKIKNDLSFDFISYYNDTVFESLYNGVILEFNSSFFLLGAEQFPYVNDYNMFVMRTDAQGNQLWKKSYPIPHSRDQGRGLIQIDSNTILFYASIGDDQGPGSATDTSKVFAYPTIVAIDTLGNTKWTWNWDGTKTEGWIGLRDLIITDDGEYIYSAVESNWSITTGFFFRPIAVKLNQSREEVWHLVLDTTYFLPVYLDNVLMTLDSNFLFSGTYWYYFYHAKVTPDGTKLWDIKDSSKIDEWSFTRIKGTDLLSSGSIISGGEAAMDQTNGGRAVWSFLLKMNSNGCVDTLNCWPVSIIEPTQPIDYQLSVFPNPASHLVNIQLKNSPFRKGRIIITNLAGQMVKTFRYSGNEVVWELDDVTNGLYFCRLEVDGELIDVQKIIVCCDP